MSKYRALLIGTAILVPIVLVAVVLAILYSSLPTREQRVEDQAGLPLLLEPEGFGQGPARGEITLKPDGIAELKEFPVGKVNWANGQCTSWDGATTYSGEASWAVDGDYIFTIETSDGEVAIAPYAPAFSEIAWYRFGLPLCDDQGILWYWKAAGE